MEIRFSHACLVHHRRRQRFGPAQSNLDGHSGLGSLLESPTICNTLEGPWNKLGIIHETSSSEYLILVAHVPVNPTIKRIAGFRERWVRCVVGNDAGQLDRKSTRLNSSH